MVAAVAALVVPSIAYADLADKQALAERFAPVVRLVEQVEECGTGEPYKPMDVDVLFDEPTVALRGPWNADGSGEDRSDAPRMSPRPATSTTWTSPATRSIRAATTNAGPAGITGGSAPDRLLPRHDRGRPTGRVRAPVLALLRLQQFQQPARGRLGEHSAGLRCVDDAREAIETQSRQSIGYSSARRRRTRGVG